MSAACERISVIVPAFQAERTLRACIEAVIAAGPYEVVIVDDGSCDATPRIIEDLVRVHPALVRCVRLPENRGPASARNAGARAASGEHYFFVDADTVLADDALERYRFAAARADAVSGVYDPEPLNEGVVPRYKALFDHFHFARRGVVPYDGFSAYCGGIRAAAFDAVGGFDERLGPGMEYELEELGYRLSSRFATILDPSIRARHHFPGFARLTRTYFRRVRQWTQLAIRRGRFESAGDATASTGLATACALGALCTAPLSLVWPPLAVLPCALGAAWLIGYGPFFVFVARERPSMLLPAMALNAWFSVVIGLGACAGVLALLAGRGEVLARERPPTPA
jgi:hypothetical protein